MSEANRAVRLALREHRALETTQVVLASCVATLLFLEPGSFIVNRLDGRSNGLRLQCLDVSGDLLVDAYAVAVEEID